MDRGFCTVRFGQRFFVPVMHDSLKLRFTKMLLAFSLLCSITSAAGLRDERFGIRGKVKVDPAPGTFSADLAVREDGSIVVGGHFTDQTGRTSAFLQGFSRSGTKDPAFGIAGTAKVSLDGASVQIRDIALTGDGGIVAAGKAVFDDGTSDFFVARFDERGRPDPGFGDAGLLTADIGKHDEFASISVLKDGRLVVAGGTDEKGITAVVFRFESDGRLDDTFGRRGIAQHIFQHVTLMQVRYPSDVEIMPDGNIYVGGDWDFILDNLPRSGSYVITFSQNGADLGLNGTEYSLSNGAACGASFDGKVLPDGTYVYVSRQGGINPFHDGANLTVLPDGRLVAAGGCRGGGIKVYDPADMHVIGVDREITARRSDATPDGSIAVLTAENEIVLLKGVTSQGTRQQNFSNDNKADFAVYRPSERRLFINDGGGSVSIRELPSDAVRIIPENAEFISSMSGIVRDTLAFWSRGTYGAGPESFSILERFGGLYFGHSAGQPGDIPFAGDFDGDGAVDTGLFRPSEGVWLRKAHLASTAYADLVSWGAEGDKPVPADYDGDGITDIAIFRPSNGTWWVKRSSGGSWGAQFGIPEDIPLTGDFDADGKADLTVFRRSEGNWYQLLSSEGFRVVNFGLSTDEPVPADYDGDGRTDIAVFREGIWYMLQSREGFKAFSWGLAGDQPVTARYDH